MLVPELDHPLDILLEVRPEGRGLGAPPVNDAREGKPPPDGQFPALEVQLIKISQLNNVLNILPSVEEAIDAVFLKEIESGLQEEDDIE